MKSKVIVKYGTRYYRAAETKDFIFFVNYNESDDCIMFTHSGKLISDNYFASVGLNDAIVKNELTYKSKRMKAAISYLRANEPDFFETNDTPSGIF